MIEIKCSKAQYKRIITALSTSGLINGKCVLGKDGYSCPSVNGKNPSLTCTECLRKNIVRMEGSDGNG